MKIKRVVLFLMSGLMLGCAQQTDVLCFAPVGDLALSTDDDSLSIAEGTLPIADDSVLTTAGSVLTTEESDKLREIEINNEFLSGCVTEYIFDLSEQMCASCEHNGDNEGKVITECEDDLSAQFSYEQWVEIYNMCIVL